MKDRSEAKKRAYRAAADCISERLKLADKGLISGSPEVRAELEAIRDALENAATSIAQSQRVPK